MMHDLCSFGKSTTRENLMRAFAGESQARNRYTFAASECAAKGLFVLEKLFLFTAAQEKEHAELFYHRLCAADGTSVAIHGEYPVGVCADPAALLREAQHNEMQEYSHDYRLFSQIAQQEGFEEIASLFRLIAQIELTHSQRFTQYADLLESGRLFTETEHTAWLCLNCGHIHSGTQAPALCPVCTHPQGYFVRAQQAIGA